MRTVIIVFKMFVKNEHYWNIVKQCYSFFGWCTFLKVSVYEKRLKWAFDPQSIGRMYYSGIRGGTHNYLLKASVWNIKIKVWKFVNTQGGLGTLLKKYNDQLIPTLGYTGSQGVHISNFIFSMELTVYRLPEFRCSACESLVNGKR